MKISEVRSKITHIAAKVASKFDANVTKLSFRILVISLVIVVYVGIVFAFDVVLFKNNYHPGVFNKIIGENGVKYRSLFSLGKAVYYQDVDQDIQGVINAYFQGGMDELPLTNELDPSFDLTRTGVHIDLIEIGGASTYYIYSVLPRSLQWDEIPVSVKANGDGEFVYGTNICLSGVMTVTTDKDYSFDLFLDTNHIEDFFNLEIGEKQTYIFFDYNGVKVIAPYTYRIIEKPVEAN